MVCRRFLYGLSGVFVLLFCFLLSGCSNQIINEHVRTERMSSDVGNSSESKSYSITGTNEKITAVKNQGISVEDFDVNYLGIILNDKTSLEMLSTKLNITINEDKEDNNTIDTRGTGSNNDMDYYWFQISYPNKDQADLVFDYLYNATTNTGRIVSIDLKNIPTRRGISVGNTIEQIKQVYGNDIISKPDTDNTFYTELMLGNNELIFMYEKETGKVNDIYIDFDSNKAMEEMDITGFGD